MKALYYVYFHDSDFVPIHVAEMVSAMHRISMRIEVFTSFNRKSNLHEAFDKTIKLHNFTVPKVRFISELLFMGLLFPFLLVKSIVNRPKGFYVRQSTSSLLVAIIARILRLPCYIEVNDILLDKLKFTNASKLKLTWVDFYHRYSFRLSTMLLPVTSEIGAWVQQDYSIDSKKVQVVPNGVNIQRFEPKPIIEARQRYGIKADCHVITCLGSLFPWAGMEVLIEAAPFIIREWPDTVFLIGSGEEPYLSQMRNLIDQKHLSCFHFRGFIPWDEAAWFISTADLCAAPFVFKNIRSGISSLRVLSYLACARPVVGSDIPGLGDMLEREKIGISTTMSDGEHLSVAICSLLRDSDCRAQMGSRAREFVKRHYSWEALASQIQMFYNRGR